MTDFKENYEELANAIIKQAVVDYRDALIFKDPVFESDCERFFESQWWCALTQLDAKTIRKGVRKQVGLNG